MQMRQDANILKQVRRKRIFKLNLSILCGFFPVTNVDWKRSQICVCKESFDLFSFVIPGSFQTGGL